MKYLQSQYNRKAWCFPFETEPLLLALVAKKAKYDAPNLENCILRPPTNKENKAGNSSPSISKLIIAVTSKSVGLIVVKGKIKPFIEVT